MWLFEHFSGQQKMELSKLLPAIDRAVSLVDPRLKQGQGYPEAYRKPVLKALEYSNALVDSIPSPVVIDRSAYARDAFVHALFPSVDSVFDAFCSSRAIQNYHHDFPVSNTFYALMGMRRRDKKTLGMEISGELIQRDVLQNIVYFTEHTIVHPAPDEQQAREKVALGFFDCLAQKVEKRIDERRKSVQSLQQEKDLLMARIRMTAADDRPVLNKELSRLIKNIQSAFSSLDLRNYIDDFEAVLLHPDQHLRLDQVSINLDRMGVKHGNGDPINGDDIIFNELIGFDRRAWTITMVHCSNIPFEAFTMKHEKALRELVL